MAVNVSNIEIAWYDSTLMGLVQLSRRSTSDSFSFGDLVSDSSADGSYAGTCDVVASADKSQFLGVSLSTLDGAKDTDSKVLVGIKAIIKVPLASGQTTIYFGEAAIFATGGNGTSWTLNNSASEGIVHCFDESVVAGAAGRFTVDPYSIRAVTVLGYFELVS